MAQYGRLKEFDADSEPITVYLERVELFSEVSLLVLLHAAFYLLYDVAAGAYEN